MKGGSKKLTPPPPDIYTSLLIHVLFSFTLVFSEAGMKRRCFSRAKFTLWAIAVIVVLSYVGKLQDNNEQNQKQISALKKVVADTQSMLSRAGLSVVEMQVIIESTGAMDFLSMSSELDKVEERRKLVAPNILAAMGNVIHLFFFASK